MRFLMIAAMGALALPGSAGAALQDSQQEAEEAEGAINSSNRVICRRMPPPPGTRIGGRNICATEAQWERYQRETRDVLDEAFNRSKVVTIN